MTFRKFPYYCVLFIVTLSTLFLSCNNLLLEKKNADFSVQITMPPAYSTTAGSEPLTGGDISTEAPAEKWNLIAWVEEEGNPEHLSPQTISAMSGEIKKINFEKIDVNLKVRVCMTLESSEGKEIYKGESKWFVTQPGTNNISLELVKVPVDALEPVIKNQSNTVYITEDNETVDLFIEAYSPDGGTLSFIWEKQDVSEKWERVSIPQSVEETDGQIDGKQIRLFKSKITVSEKGTYQCIVLNTNIDATGNITAKKTSSLIEVPFVEGSLKSFEVEGYMVFGSGNKDNLKVYAIYSNNGEDNRVPITDLDGLELVSGDTDSIGYVPYTVKYNDSTKDLKIPTKYKLEANNIELESYFNNNYVSSSNEDKLSVPRYATLSCSYGLNNISLKLIDENGNENQIKTINEYYRATITNSSNISEGDYCETTGEYKVTLNSNNNWFVCEEDNNKEFYVEVCPWEIKFTEANGTNGNPVFVENLKIDTTYMLSVANKALENHDLQVEFAGEGVYGGETTGNYFFVIPEKGVSTITAKTNDIEELAKIDVKVGDTEEISIGYNFFIGSQQEKGFDPNDVKFENNTVSVTHPETTTIDSVFNYYIRAVEDLKGEDIFNSGSNYRVSLQMKADKPTVVGIQAAYADMFFTVGTEWATYEFETGYIDVVSSNEDGYDKNGITIGSALTEKLYFNNVNVEQVANDNLPALVFNVTKQGIEKHLSNIGNNVEIDSDNKVTNGIINVSRAVDSTGYDITINTPVVSEESTSHDKDGKVQYYDNDVSLQLRGYANKGMNKVSVDVIPLNSSSFYTSILSQPFSKKTLSWNNSPVVINEETLLYDYFPSYEETDVVTVDVLARSTSNTSSESTSFSIKDFSVKSINPVEEEDFAKTILVQKESSWYEFNDNNNMEILIEKSGNIQIIMLDKYLWDDGIFPTNGWEKITRIYYIEDLDTGRDGDYITFDNSVSFPITLSLTDDFTVQIEEVESESGSTSGDTGNDSGTGDSSNNANTGTEATIISEEVNGLQYVSINNVSGINIHNDVGLKTYSQMVNGTLEETITFNNDNGDFLQSFSAGTSYYLNGYLMGDVTVSDWVPIGTSNKPFTGSFDGQGHTITINSLDESNSGDYAGVFGCAGKGSNTTAIISNLVVKGSDEGINTSALYVGGIVAYCNGATITNCVNFADLETTSNETVYAGGIVGYYYQAGTVSKCINLGNISSSVSESGYCSGIIGSLNAENQTKAKVVDCINLGSINAESTSSGIVWDSYQWGTSIEVTSCLNVGSMTGTSVYAIANEGIESNCYYREGITTSNLLDNSETVISKTTSELCKLNEENLLSGWSFGETYMRYPLPDLSNVFTQTIWDEIVGAATL